MADPILVGLCAVCRIAKPRYTCPRCNQKTCSLACVNKHKSWARCNGQRNPGAYVPRAQLRTAAGINHDYNFLHGLDLSLERAERVLIHDKGLLRNEDLRPPTVQQVKWQTGRDGRSRKVVVTRQRRPLPNRRLERTLAQRLLRLNVEMVFAPMGMARQQENKTTAHRGSGAILWQVEWFVRSTEDLAKRTDGEALMKRILSKIRDDMPIYRAYHTLLAATTKGSKAPVKIRSKDACSKQCQTSRGAWSAVPYTMQDNVTCRWILRAATDEEDARLNPEDEAQRRRYQYFLAGAPRQSDLPKCVHALQPDDCLWDVLANTRVREFPTLYVLDAGVALPNDFQLGPKELITSHPNLKRKWEPHADEDGNDGGSGGPMMRWAQMGAEAQFRDAHAQGENHPDKEGNRVGGDVTWGLDEAGKFVAEGFGREAENGEGEGEEEEEEDDSTSSSGSDGESVSDEDEGDDEKLEENLTLGEVDEGS